MSDENLPLNDKPPSRDQQTTILSGISGATLSYLPGDVVDSAYQLLRLLGRGGMGAVYECRHQTLDKHYAIKLLAGSQLSSETWTRFQAEAQSLARLHHPGIVGIFNMGIDKNQCPYFVMDLLNGQALDARIKHHGQIPVKEALNIFIQVADALSSAHAQGIIHRDIKPSNIMLLSDVQGDKSKVKIVDFGIARLPKQNAAVQSQTATGLIFGTPFYMSPEQCEGARVDERSDIYSMGCALFEALTGAPPFVGDSAFHTFMMHQSEPAPSLSSKTPKQEFPESLELAVKKMLNKKAIERYQNMKQVQHDLERILAGKAIMAQGDNATITPKQLVPAGGLDEKHIGRARSDFAKTDINYETEGPKAERRRFPFSHKVFVLASLFLIVAATGIVSVVLLLSKSTDKEKVQDLSISHDDDDDDDDDDGGYSELRLVPTLHFKKMGATAEELKITESDVGALKESEERAEKDLAARLKKDSFATKPFEKDGLFHFPKDIFIGWIKFDNHQPILASGELPAPKDKNICLYLITSTGKSPDLLKKFGPADLTGIAMVFTPGNTNLAIDQISHWTRLKDVWFFNPLLKTVTPATEWWAESKMEDSDLPRLNNLKNITGLGLCWPISGPAILAQVDLHRLKALRLENIEKFAELLNELPKFDNIEELFLMNQKISDNQLATLAKMLNLHKLTVLRSHLTTNSFKWFELMTGLKELRLDRNDWTDEQKAKLQEQIPNCQVTYEKVIDKKYWPLYPADVQRFAHPIPDENRSELLGD